MRKLLLAGVALLALTTTSQAAIVGDLGVNPTSSQGAFANQNLPTGAFADQWTFQIVGNQLLTIASATNVYPNPVDDFITGFNGAVYQIVGSVDANPGTGDDILRFGPKFATPDNCDAGCQVFGGSGLISTGNYYLNIAGSAGITAGYGGDLAVITSPVPEPSTWAMMLLGFCGLAWFGVRKRRQEMQFRPV
jgi:hypothetical protein